MSIRVPNGYRLKKGVDLWKFVDSVREQAEVVIRTRLTTLYKEFDKAGREDLNKLNDTLVALDLPEDRRLKKCDFWELSLAFRKMFQVQHARMEKHPFGMNVGLAIRKIKGRYGVLPIANGFMQDALNFLEDHPMLESYWVHTGGDRPEDISAREWRARAKYWGDASQSKAWLTVLALDILTPDTFFDLDPSRDLIRDDSRTRKAVEATLAATAGTP